MGRLVRDDRKATITQITTRYNQGMQNTISERTTHRTLKQMGYSSRRPHRVPLIIWRKEHESMDPSCQQPYHPAAQDGCPLKLSRLEPGQYLGGRPPGKARLQLEVVLVRPAEGAHPAVCVDPNASV